MKSPTIKHVTEHYIFMLEASQDFDFSQCALTVCLMLKGGYLFNGHLGFGQIVIGRSGNKQIAKT